MTKKINKNKRTYMAPQISICPVIMDSLMTQVSNAQHNPIDNNGSIGDAKQSMYYEFDEEESEE